MSAQPRQTLPWSISDARSSFLPMVFGVVLMAWAWWDASGTGKLDDQTRAVVLAVLGVTVTFAGACAWVAAGRRAVRDRRRQVISAVERTGLAAPATASRSDASVDLVFVAGTKRYHRRDCLLTRGKAASAFDEDPRTTTRRPCEMCRP